MHYCTRLYLGFNLIICLCLIQTVLHILMCSRGCISVIYRHRASNEMRVAIRWRVAGYFGCVSSGVLSQMHLCGRRCHIRLTDNSAPIDKRNPRQLSALLIERIINRFYDKREMHRRHARQIRARSGASADHSSFRECRAAAHMEICRGSLARASMRDIKAFSGPVR